MVRVSFEFKKKDFLWVVPLVLVLAVGFVFAVAVDPNVMGHGNIWVDDATGNVGIGTATPNSDIGIQRVLHISGSAHAGLVLEDTEETNKWNLWTNTGSFRIRSSERSTAAMTALANGDVLFEDGNIGIGTSSPLAKLHVAGDLKVDGNILRGCISGTMQVIDGFCIDSSLRNAKNHPSAEYECFGDGGHICSYNEVYAASVSTSVISRTTGMWLRGICGDDSRLYVNGGVNSNFDGCAGRGDSRSYRCCYSNF